MPQRFALRWFVGVVLVCPFGASGQGVFLSVTFGSTLIAKVRLCACTSVAALRVETDLPEVEPHKNSGSSRLLRSGRGPPIFRS